jgi:hypothetical protein
MIVTIILAVVVVVVVADQGPFWFDEYCTRHQLVTTVYFFQPLDPSETKKMTTILTRRKRPYRRYLARTLP